MSGDAIVTPTAARRKRRGEPFPPQRPISRLLCRPRKCCTHRRIRSHRHFRSRCKRRCYIHSLPGTEYRRRTRLSDSPDTAAVSDNSHRTDNGTRRTADTARASGSSRHTIGDSPYMAGMAMASGSNRRSSTSAGSTSPRRTSRPSKCRRWPVLAQGSLPSPRRALAIGRSVVGYASSADSSNWQAGPGTRKLLHHDDR